MRRLIAVLLLFVSAALLPDMVLSAGWADLTYGEWLIFAAGSDDRDHPSYSGGIILGVMNAFAQTGVQCPRPVSALEMIARLRSTPRPALPETSIAEAVAMAMAELGCGHPENPPR